MIVNLNASKSPDRHGNKWLAPKLFQKEWENVVNLHVIAPITTRVSFSFFGDVAFSGYFLYHFRFLFVWTIEYVVRSFLPNGVFLPWTTGWIFYISLCENSINQSIDQSIIGRNFPVNCLKKNQNAPRPSKHPPVRGRKCQNV